MKKIGILTAMSVEHEQIVRLLTAPTPCQRGIHHFTTGHIGETEIWLLQCGIGKVNAALGAATLIEHFAPEAIISTGVAGGIDAQLRVMDVVASTQTAYHDVWCGEGNAKGQVQGLPERFTAADTLLRAAEQLARETAESSEASRVQLGLICTGDQFITNRDELSRIKATFPEALAVDMESAAIAQTCHLYGLPFVSFRIISDTPGIDNHWQQYTDFWGEMAQRSFGITQRFLSLIGQ